MLQQQINQIRRSSSIPQTPDSVITPNQFIQASLGPAQVSSKFSLAQTHRRDSLGLNHPATAANFQHQARIREATGDFAGSAQLYEESVRAYEGSVGPEHPNIAGTLAEWAEVLEQVGETDRALALYERAAEIVRTKLPPEHTGREMLLERYQTFLQRLGEDS